MSKEKKPEQEQKEALKKKLDAGEHQPTEEEIAAYKAQIEARVVNLRDIGIYRLELLEILERKNNILDEGNRAVLELGQKLLDRFQDLNANLNKLLKKDG